MSNTADTGKTADTGSLFCRNPVIFLSVPLKTDSY